MFQMDLPENVQTILGVLRKNGFIGYVVGGCVRDACNGIAPHDFDMTTDASPEEMLRCFADFRTLQTGIKHGTITVILDHEPYEITTFRIDGDYTDHRHPDGVTFTKNIVDDLARRDFTVNAMAYDGQNFVDPFDGQGDLQKGLIRCVGQPDKRFQEDGLRILRALRFAAVLGFQIDEQTSQSIFRNKDLLACIAVERLFVELKKLVCGQDAQRILNDYAPVLRVFLPELSSEGIRALHKVPADIITRFALLFPEQPSETLQNLRCDKKTIQAVVELTETSLTDVPHLLSKLDKPQAHRLVDCALALGIINEPQALHEEIERTTPITLRNLAVNGSDLQKSGLQGQDIGKVLDDLLEQVLCGLPNRKDILLQNVKIK